MSLRMLNPVLDFRSTPNFEIGEDFLTWAIEEFELVNARLPEQLRLTGLQCSDLARDCFPGDRYLNLDGCGFVSEFRGIPIERSG